MPTTSATGRDPTPAPSTTKPVMVKNRPSQAEKLASQNQQNVRRQPAPKPAVTSPSGLGRRIDVRA